ncbi:MAG TPA: ATP-binding protein [Smithella sp.]|nr:ATP-binding protein [Smithella sp.]
MARNGKTKEELLQQIDDLQTRLDEAQETLGAIRRGEVDALVVSGDHGDSIFTLEGEDYTYRILVESMNEGAAKLNADGIILYANSTLADMLKVPLENLIGSRLTDHIDSNHISNFEALFTQGFTGCCAREIAMRTTGEGTLPVHISARRIKMNMKGELGIIVTDLSVLKQNEAQLREAHDQLERKVLERTSQLEAANKELESFSYTVSHDLRAPLRAIDGYSRMILKDLQDKIEADTKRKLNLLRENIKEMGQLIDDLLELSRLGRRAIETDAVNMEKLIQDVWEENKSKTENRNINFRMKNILAAVGDEALIKQVIVNLIANALKFTRTREEACIQVGCKKEEKEVVYYIKDNGVGFDMAHYNKLFGVFQRLHSASDFEGTGIGLSIVQRIVHRHGGRAWANSKVDKGSTFYFSLPG